MEFHITWFCESRGVQFPPATHLMPGSRQRQPVRSPYRLGRREGPGPVPRHRAAHGPWADPVAARWLAARRVVAIVGLVAEHHGAEQHHRFIVVVDAAAVEVGRVDGDRDVPGLQIVLGLDGAAVSASAVGQEAAVGDVDGAVGIDAVDAAVGEVHVDHGEVGVAAAIV